MDMDKVRLYAFKAMDFFGEAVSEARNEVQDKAFFDGIEIGIRVTISSLYESGVSDEKIINLLNKYWEIPRQESVDRLRFEKVELCKRELREYLILQGWSSKDVNSYYRKQMIGAKIRNNKELWGLWSKPEKLKQEIEKLQ